jgi:hypothetical protein
MREQLVPDAAAGRLVWMLFNGFTPMFSGMVGLALTAILILGAAIAARSPHRLPLRVSGSRSAWPRAFVKNGDLGHLSRCWR